MPDAHAHKKIRAILAVMATSAVFKEAVSGLRSMVIAASGTEYVRPTASGSLSAWLGQRKAATTEDTSMLVPATVEDINTHIQSAIQLTHPIHQHSSRLPEDVRDAIKWIVQKGATVAVERTARLKQLTNIQESLSNWDAYLWREGVVEHIKNMVAYRPRLAFIHALVVALEWPFKDLVASMAVGFDPVGVQPDTGVWRLDPPERPAECFERLKEEDPEWNDRLMASIKHEGLKPENQVIAWAAWQRTQEEVRVGWSSPVVGGRAELETRFGARNIRLMRRFGVTQAGGKCRCCDSGTASGHNPCTEHPERLVNVRADFPLEVAAQFAAFLEFDGTWTMHVSTNDVVAAFRRVACADPSTTIVAQWDPRPKREGGQRVALFYVQGFNFGIKSAVMAYNAIAEFQTRAAVRLLPVVACHYFDDWCCAEPDYSCANAQYTLEAFMRLTGIGLDGVTGRDGVSVPAKKQKPSLVQKFLGVITDFTHFSKLGKVRMHVPQARIDKVREMIAEAICTHELSAGAASSLCGKLQFCLAWGFGRFGRAAMGPLYQHAHARFVHIGAALEMSLQFFQTALMSLKARDICVKATGYLPPILIWTDATGTNEGEDQPVIAFVARYPGGVIAPSDPVGVVVQQPRWVHGYQAVPPEVLGQLEKRRQQVGQLELLAAASVYYSLSPWLHKRDVIHFIDNTAAASGMAKGYSYVIDSARIIHAFHALNVNLQTNVHFEWVKSEANIADMPTRNNFALLHEFGSQRVALLSPPMSSWRTPEELHNFAQGVARSKTRGGRRHS